MNYGQILDIILQVVAVFMAIVLHEAAHGYVAYRLGDPTAKQRGRLTLNPLAHVDLIGTVLVPVFLVLVGSSFLFGWAKPVPVNPMYFRNRFRGMLLVAIAGPGTNFALALTTGLVGRLLLGVIPESVLFNTASFAGSAARSLMFLLGVFVIYNVILGIFNMIPIPPLDGSRVLTYFLPTEGRRIMLSLERYGFFILIALLYFNVLDGLFRGITPVWRFLLGNEWILAMSVVG